MNLNDLLNKEGIDPHKVLVFRHSPVEPKLKKVLPWLAAENPELFNAYQQTQKKQLQDAMERMSGSGYVASFIGDESGATLFVGLYAIGAAKPLTIDEYLALPKHIELQTMGMKGFDEEEGRDFILQFELEPTNFYPHWKGKLKIAWPPGRLFWRRSHNTEMPVLSILEESAFETEMPEWHEIVLTWEELRLLPTRWRNALSHWRGIYYISDTSDGKGYVGSAYGNENLFGRWLDYAARGHGGNQHLRERNPNNFRFSILQRVSPDMVINDLVSLENSWKERLHTRQPFGLNGN